MLSAVWAMLLDPNVCSCLLPQWHSQQHHRGENTPLRTSHFSLVACLSFLPTTWSVHSAYFNEGVDSMALNHIYSYCRTQNNISFVIVSMLLIYIYNIVLTMISAVWAMLLDPSVCSSVCLPRHALLSFDRSYKHFKKVTTNYNNKLI